MWPGWPRSLGADGAVSSLPRSTDLVMATRGEFICLWSSQWELTVWWILFEFLNLITNYFASVYFTLNTECVQSKFWFLKTTFKQFNMLKRGKIELKFNFECLFLTYKNCNFKLKEGYMFVVRLQKYL